MIEKIKNSNIKELKIIASDVRNQIIETVSKNGGHIAPSLGTVEMTIALLKVFNLPKDKIIWDVGHQTYAFKILTDRKHEFNTLRQYKGISGFPKISESKFDTFGTGHGGTSISAMLGIKEALQKKQELSKVISIIGDGAMTNGLAFEAMNHIREMGQNTITILNDNEMSISTSVGSLSKWFSRQLTGPTYSFLRSEIKEIVAKLPAFFHADKIIEIIRKALNSSKTLLTPGILFEGFGFQYVGPIDGHNIEELIETLEDLKQNPEPVLLHIHTTKGKGYKPSEENPRKFHGIGPFNIKTGETKKSSPSFTNYLSKYLPNLFRRNNSLVAITAAMPDGTGLFSIEQEFPEKFYDVGMSEGHGVTFAAGLAAGGLKPIVAIYSTFLQRALDSIIHDVALQNLPVIFLVDRAGIVGDDGPTHHGIFDITFLRMVPNLTLLAPRNEIEMAKMIEFAIKQNNPVAIRYPRGSGEGSRVYKRVAPIKHSGELLIDSDGETLIISIGIMAKKAIESAKIINQTKEEVSVFDLKFIKPIPQNLFETIEKKKIKRILTIEENVVSGGAGSAIFETLLKKGFKNLEIVQIGIEDKFPTHGEQNFIREKEGLSIKNIVKNIERMLNNA
jgi:1-deoxy-D-xylulose-5-phosphate synthase